MPMTDRTQTICWCILGPLFVLGAYQTGKTVLRLAKGNSFPGPAASRLPDERVPRRSPPAVGGAPFALFAAIRQVESAGNDYAVGDDGISRGPYQITRAYWHDACEHAGVDWEYDTYVWDPDRCEYLMMAYWDRYGARTDEERARCHNSGPKWRQKYRLTNGYWAKVKAAMLFDN